jgi:hypothetical protein
MKDQVRRDLAVKQRELQERLIAEARVRKQLKKENEDKIKEEHEQALQENLKKAQEVKRME